MAAEPFRYFERIDEAANRFEFWEIAREGATLLLRAGPVGTPGHGERELCASETTAREEYTRRIAAQLADGFRECTDRRLDARTRALEEVLVENLDDEAAWLVYADWIQTLGDPRGGLIVAQASAHRDRAAAFLEQHAALFLGPLADHLGYDGALLELQWRFGYIWRARLASRISYDDRPARVLELLLDHPSTRWLVELDIDLAHDTIDVGAVIDVLAARDPRPLRKLTIGEVGEWREPTDEIDWDYPPPARRLYLDRLWPALARVRHLIIRGEPAAFGGMTIPCCEHLELHTRRIAPQHAEALEHARCPGLQRLDLRYRTFRHAAVELQPLLAGGLLRRISHLAITNTANDELCATIAMTRSKALRELDLSNGVITDEGARHLADSDLELDILDITRNGVSPGGVAELGRIARLVIADQQRG